MPGYSQRPSSWSSMGSAIGDLGAQNATQGVGGNTSALDAAAQKIAWDQESDAAIDDASADGATWFGGFVDDVSHAWNTSDVGQAVNEYVGYEPDQDQEPNPFGPTPGVKTPQWVLDAQAYNQWRVTERFREVATLALRAGGDHDAYTWALHEVRTRGHIGLAFSYLVASAQEEVNARLERGPDEGPMKVDGCLGPDTESRMKRHVGLKDARTSIALDEKDIERQQEDMEKAGDDASEQFEDVDSIWDISRAGGDLVDALLPNPGDKKSLEVGINCPMFGGVAKFGLFASIAGERQDSGKIKIRCEAGASLSGELETWIATAWAKAKLYGYVEIVADDAAEVFDLLMLAIHEEVEDVSEDLADYMWGSSFESDVVEDMDDKDYVEYGLGASVEAGVKWGGGNMLTGPGDDYEASAGIEGQWGNRITRGDEIPGLGVMAKSQFVEVYTAKLGCSLPGGWSGELAYKNAERGGKASGGVELKAQREIDMMDFASQLSTDALNEQLIGYAGRVAGLVQGLIQEDSGLLKDDSSQQVGAAMDTIASGSFGIPVGVSEGISKLKDKYGKFGQKLSQVMTLSVGWDDKGKVELDFEICGGNTVNWGDKTDPIYLEFQSLSRILKIPTITLAAGA